jgi:hypothetical protein
VVVAVKEGRPVNVLCRCCLYIWICTASQMQLGQTTECSRTSKKERVLLLGQASRQGSIIYTASSAARGSISLTLARTHTLSCPLHHHSHPLAHARTHAHTPCLLQDAVALLLASDQLHTRRAATPWSCRSRVASDGHLVAPVSASQIQELGEGAQCDSLAANFLAASCVLEPGQPWPSLCGCGCECLHCM